VLKKKIIVGDQVEGTTMEKIELRTTPPKKIITWKPKVAGL